MKIRYSKLLNLPLAFVPFAIVASCNNTSEQTPKKPQPPVMIDKEEAPQKPKNSDGNKETSNIQNNINKPIDDKQEPKKQDPQIDKKELNNSQNPAEKDDTNQGSSPSNINQTNQNSDNLNNGKDKNNKEPIKTDDKNTNPEKEKDSELQDSKQDDFSDLNILTLNINLNIVKYQEYDALSYKEFIKDNPNSLISLLQVPEDLHKKYSITLESYELLNTDNEKGIISEINLKFTLKNTDKFKVLKYSLSGFKTLKDMQNNNPKYNFITEQEPSKYQNFLKLFPSLVGAFMLWNKNDQVQTKLQNNSLSSTYGFESLANKEGNQYFKDHNIVLNPSLPYFFLKLNEKDKEKYDFKISAINVNDIDGNLTLEIDVFDRSESLEQNKYPDISKKLSFANFASFNKNLNDFEFTIDFQVFDTNLKKYTKLNKKLKEDIFAKYQNQEINDEIDINNEFSAFDLETLKITLFNSLAHQMNNNIYQVLNDQNILKISESFALQGNYSIYPFLTKFNNENLNLINIKLAKVDGKLTIKFNIEYSLLAFVSSGFSNLDSFEFGNDSLSKSFTYNLIKD